VGSTCGGDLAATTCTIIKRRELANVATTQRYYFWV